MSDANESTNPRSHELRDRLKQLTQPLVDSLDSRLREQIDSRVDERVDDTLATRLAVLERAIADLDRSVKELQARTN